MSSELISPASNQEQIAERMEAFPCYVQNSCPFPETETRWKELKNSTILQGALREELTFSRHAYSAVWIPREGFVHPEDICIKWMLTLFAEDMCEVTRVLESIWSIDRQDISQMGFLNDYLSEKWTLFQRSVFLFIRSIQEIDRKYASNGFRGFGDKCSDIIKDFVDCETF